jgi:ABC-2 type transport system permease protein
MTVVFWKELADHFSNRRFMILLMIIIFTALWSTYSAGLTIRQDAENMPTEFVFLLLLTSQSGALLSLATFLGFLGPLVGITLGFDAISGEYARGTLSRVLSQPPDQRQIPSRACHGSNLLGLHLCFDHRSGNQPAWIFAQR